MAQRHDLFGSLQDCPLGQGRTGKFYSLPRLEQAGVGAISRLPRCLRVVLESVLRHHDGKRIQEADVRRLAEWRPDSPRMAEIPFIVARVLLQDFTGVPLLVDLAAMRSAITRLGRDAALIEPLVPVDLVVDHSIQVDVAGSEDALRLNMEREARRNGARYRFLKWGQQAFKGFHVVPPGVGIVHQVNLEYLARGVLQQDGIYFPDTLVGTDSHTTMINGLGVVGWGVGGIEAEAAMLGQPVYFLPPDVVGVHLTGALAPGVTATDLVLHLTEMLRQARVVGKFVEFHGAGAANLTLPDRATVANMAPEYGATMGYFPVDEQSCQYLTATGRDEEQVDAFRSYFQAQEMFGMPGRGDIDYSALLELDLATVVPSVAGPSRPQDRIRLPEVKARFRELLHKPESERGYHRPASEAARRLLVRTGVPVSRNGTSLLLQGGGHHPSRRGGVPAAEVLPDDGNGEPETGIERGGVPVSRNGTSVLLKAGGRWPSAAAAAPARAARTNGHPAHENEGEMVDYRPTPSDAQEAPVRTFPCAMAELGHGSVVIAAITSCTNTSNPGVMLAAGLLAKEAVERGLSVGAAVKTSLAPGSRVVTDYLSRTGLQIYLDILGFHVVGYGCTTCIGNSGPLDPHLEAAITGQDLIVASVLSGNRNFEARVHQSVRANFLMSPPLVIAFALAGRVDIDLSSEPLGRTLDGHDVYLEDLWPDPEEVRQVLHAANDPKTYRACYLDLGAQNSFWQEVPAGTGTVYNWEPASTYIREPPYFKDFGLQPRALKPIRAARVLAIFGDSVTTDHISPAGAIKPASPAGLYLQERGKAVEDLNTYGARRGNHEVMVRGTFANVRIRNLMVPGVTGPVTLYQPGGERMSIYDAAIKYQEAGVPLVVIAGQEYGTGSSRDWAAKGTLLLGVKAVIAESFERIHRSNLVGMGVLPCQFEEGAGARSLRLDGTETFDLLGLEAGITPQQEVTLVIHRAGSATEEARLRLRIDTPVEADYYLHGGILPYTLRKLLAHTPA